MMTTLSQQTCRECGCAILVSSYHPHPDEEYTTGCSAHRWDGDRQQDYFVGWICHDCAFSMVGEGLPGSISGPDLMFHY